MTGERTKTYSEKLRDPRWQKKRLEILELDKWTCQTCGDTESTLHVHHRTYFDGRDPWDYGTAWLVTLCEACHQNEEGERPMVEKKMRDALRLHLFCLDMHILADAIREGLGGFEETHVSFVVRGLARLIRGNHKVITDAAAEVRDDWLAGEPESP